MKLFSGRENIYHEGHLIVIYIFMTWDSSTSPTFLFEISYSQQRMLFFFFLKTARLTFPSSWIDFSLLSFSPPLIAAPSVSLFYLQKAFFSFTYLCGDVRRKEGRRLSLSLNWHETSKQKSISESAHPRNHLAIKNEKSGTSCHCSFPVWK